MNYKSENLQAIPTNIISGFLGVGKTTTILSLLKAKPQKERWAVLVNEFGEIGIDGALFQGQHSENDGIFIREVPGGCMCCAAGLPMQIALNQLLVRAKPQRLLIEPTGLGHPKGVLEVLCVDYYRDVLDIQKNVTLVDARKLTDPRYTNHNTFNQQIDIADIIVGNKRDLYQGQEQSHLEKYIAERKDRNTRILFTDHGKLDPTVLEGPSNMAKWPFPLKHLKHHHHDQGLSINEVPIPECGYLKIENAGEGFHSIGWRFSPKKVFKRKALLTWFSEICIERMKAVLITDEGVFGYNQIDDSLTETKLDDCQESKIEIISRQTDSHWKSRLMDCLIIDDQLETVVGGSSISITHA